MTRRTRRRALVAANEIKLTFGKISWRPSFPFAVIRFYSFSQVSGRAVSRASRHLPQRLSSREVIVIARAEMYLAAHLEGDGPIPVDFDLVAPLGAIWQSLGAQEQHRLDECSARRHL